MTPPPAPATGRAVLTAAQERALAETIRAGRRARLLAQRHLAALPPAVSARAAAAVLAALLPRIPLAPAALPADARVRATLAAATGLPVERVDALSAPLPAPVPFDLLVGDDETATLGDLLPDGTALRPDDNVEAHSVGVEQPVMAAVVVLVRHHECDNRHDRTPSEDRRRGPRTPQEAHRIRSRRAV